MNIVPFGHNILLWRTARGWTQAQLARRARVPQPNLSDIERGSREVSLRTLRALAAAFGVRPGILADGVPPPAATGQPPAVLRREALERIAAAAAGRRTAIQPEERGVAALVRTLVQPRIDLVSGTAVLRKPGTRAARLAWMMLRARYPKALVDSLVQRASEHASRR